MVTPGIKRGMDLEAGGLDFYSVAAGKARKLSLEPSPHSTHGLGIWPSRWLPSRDLAQAMPRPGAPLSVQVGFPLLVAVLVAALGSAWKQADLGSNPARLHPVV